ncbi:MAG TPA: acylphosphatase [Sedimentisphaerales bacterium]|nr:acylphosphatase [Sedimentisphaerales bacterium]
MAAAAKHIWFSGRVQGVGFRYTARNIASRYGLTGYVRNEDDGRVEMVAQGKADDIDGCLTDIGETFGSYIRSIEVEDWVVNSDYRSFEITY